jgi:hypothetical protein
MSAGCYAPIRVGIGPTVDTERQVGVIALAAVGFGFEARPTTNGGGLTASLGAGATDMGRTPMLTVRAEPFGAVKVANDFVFLRFSGLLGTRVLFTPGRAVTLANLGIGVSALFDLSNGGFLTGSFGSGGDVWSLHLGPSVQLEYAFGDISRGFFSFPLIFEADRNLFK